MDIKNGEHIEYYDSKMIKIKANYIDGLLNGDYIEYYEKKYESRSRFIDFWVCQQIKIRAYYINGKLDNEYFELYDNGKIKKEAKYINGKLEGDVIEYNEYEFIIKKSKYVDGDLEGEYVENIKKFKSGRIKEKTYFLNRLNGLNGLNRLNELEGECIKYYDSMYNKIKSKSYYKNGLLNGIFIKYNKTGQQSISFYKNGVLNGVYIKLFNSYYITDYTIDNIDYINPKKIEIKSNYVDGKLEGKYYEYFYSNTGSIYIKIECNYTNGKLNGLYSKYKFYEYYDDEYYDLETYINSHEKIYEKKYINGKCYEKKFIGENFVEYSKELDSESEKSQFEDSDDYDDSDDSSDDIYL
jgi:antitoxin component YwqK of YwqJK toxin-antitoxin module